MLRRLLGIAVFVAAAGVVALGQDEPAVLSGVVRANGQPHAGVSVTVTRSGAAQPAASVTTGADGAYRVSVPNGVYRLEFSAKGFGTVVQPGVVLFAGRSTAINIVLTPADASPLTAISSEFRPGEVGVELATRFGIIILAVDPVHAPVTTANFLRYVDAGFYTGGRFHRATRPDNYVPAPPNRPAMELIQGGINPSRQNEGFPPIPLERTSVTGLRHVAGTVSMARGTEADTATSDFFILLDDQPSLDFGGKRFDDGQGAAAFGRVVYGMRVVREIQAQPTEGQNLTPPVAILWASRVVG